MHLIGKFRKDDTSATKSVQQSIQAAGLRGDDGLAVGAAPAQAAFSGGGDTRFHTRFAS